MCVSSEKFAQLRTVSSSTTNVGAASANTTLRANDGCLPAPGPSALAAAPPVSAVSRPMSVLASESDRFNRVNGSASAWIASGPKKTSVAAESHASGTTSSHAPARAHHSYASSSVSALAMATNSAPAMPTVSRTSGIADVVYSFARASGSGKIFCSMTHRPVAVMADAMPAPSHVSGRRPSRCPHTSHTATCAAMMPPKSSAVDVGVPVSSLFHAQYSVRRAAAVTVGPRHPVMNCHCDPLDAPLSGRLRIT